MLTPASIETRSPGPAPPSPNATSGSGPYTKLTPLAPQRPVGPVLLHLPPDRLTENEATHVPIARSPSGTDSVNAPTWPSGAGVRRTAPAVPATSASPCSVAMVPRPGTTRRLACSGANTTESTRARPDCADVGAMQRSSPSS